MKQFSVMKTCKKLSKISNELKKIDNSIPIHSHFDISGSIEDAQMSIENLVRLHKGKRW